MEWNYLEICRLIWSEVTDLFYHSHACFFFLFRRRQLPLRSSQPPTNRPTAQCAYTSSSKHQIIGTKEHFITSKHIDQPQHRLMCDLPLLTQLTASSHSSRAQSDSFYSTSHQSIVVTIMKL